MPRRPGLASASLSVMLLAAFLGTGGVFLMATRHASAQSASGGGSSNVLLNEVELNPRGRDAGGEWVEIYNPTGSAVDISNYKVKTSFRPVTITVPAGTVVGAGGFYVLAVEGDRFADANSLTLLDASGQVVSRTPSLLDKADNSYTWQRIPDGGREWRFAEATRGAANDPSSIPSSSSSNNGNAGGGNNNNNSNNNSNSANSSGGGNSQNATSASPPSSSSPSSSKAQQQSGPQCTGSAMCIEGVVKRIADADTLYVQAAGGGETYKVHLSLVKAAKGPAAESFTRDACLGSSVLVDQDDGLASGRGGKTTTNIVGVAYCASSNNLNQQLLDGGYASLDARQCSVSEFAGQEWAKRHGCS